MKKKYEKPQIYVEKFSLCTHIAGDCENDVTNPTKGTCAIILTGDIAVFNSLVANNACKFTPTEMGGTDDDKWDGFCYHVPTDYSELFNS